MSNFNFKLNTNQAAEQQITLLKSMLDIQKSILDKIDSLEKRISNIEQRPTNDSFHCSASDLRTVINQKASDISTAISKIPTETKNDQTITNDSIQQLNANISSALTQLKSHTSSLVLGATFLISCWLAAFVYWFWDVPAQTQAVNNYVYQQTEKAKIALENSSP